MTSRDLRTKNRRQEQDRVAWPDLSSVGFQTRLVGSDEALIGPILFGRAYVYPPQFSYSAVDATAGVQPDLVRPLSWPTQLMSSAEDAMDWDGWVHDPQFDMQMRHNDPYIPDLDDHLQWVGYQKIWAAAKPDLGYGDDIDGYEDDFPGAVNSWVQGVGPGPRWEVAQAYPYSDERRGGRYSAQYVFGSETESRGLYPIRPRGFYQPYSVIAAGNPDDAYERCIFSATYDGARPNQYPQGPYLPLGLNPPGTPFTFWSAIDVSAECQVEVLCRHWDASTEWAVPVGPAIYHAQLYEEVQTATLAAGQNIVEMDFGVPSNYHPNYPATDDSYYGDDAIFVTFRIRITGGSVGLRANVQRTLIWANLNDYAGTPMVTIGVAEWITNDDGAYVGAVLWAKTRDPALGSALGAVVTNPPTSYGTT